jgi:exopolysaccharide biosynthesis protein
LLPAALVGTVLIGLAAGFQLRADALNAAYEPAIVTYAASDAPLAAVRKGAGEVADGYASLADSAAASLEDLSAIDAYLTEMTEAAKQESAFDSAQRDAVQELVDRSKQHSQETEDTLESVLNTKLGNPIGQTFGKKATVKVFSLKEAGYRGYLAKVKLHDPKAIKLLMSGDKIGHKGETTSAAAERAGAVLAINAGGFSKSKNGLLYPMGVTVVDGEIVAFYQTGLSFIGFNKKGNLVGGDIQSREDVEALDVEQGATFVPTLLKDGKKLKIPSKWKNKKEPRTMIGHFSNGDLLFIVIDGRQKGYSNGVTLEEAQTKLLEWNVRDAYNLDGGGSSAFVYDGKLLNSPSDGRQRKVVSNFVVLP